MNGAPISTNFARREVPAGPVRAKADDLLDEMMSHAAAWDYRSRAAAIGDRALLLVAATRDSPDEDVTMHEEMERALRASGNRRVTLIRYDDDHPFSSHRVALADALVSWLNGDCADSQRQPKSAQLTPCASRRGWTVSCATGAVP